LIPQVPPISPSKSLKIRLESHVSYMLTGFCSQENRGMAIRQSSDQFIVCLSFNGTHTFTSCRIARTLP
jgi:hypothetical protein